MVHIGVLWIQNEQEVHLVRQWTQKLAHFVRLSIGNHARLTTAVSQIAQSLHYYNQCVSISFDIEDKDGKQWLQITLREAQNFISSGESSQQPTLSRQDLLKWLQSAQNLVTQFSIHTEAGKPIEVTLAKPIPPDTPPVTEEIVAEWNDALKNEFPRSLLEEILQQNQALIQVLDSLREKEKSLEQKISEIEALENLRDDLVHTLIHDLRNPLATIRSSLSSILYHETKNLSPHQYEMIEFSYFGARKMTRLVNNILDMHKLERQGLLIQSRPFSILKLVQKIIKAQAPLATKKNIRLSKRVTRQLSSIEGDSRMIERVLQNLVDNAIKFTPDGGRVMISAKCFNMNEKRKTNISHLAQDRYVSISVKDTGTGIPAEIESRIFEKFITGWHEERGSGLGLAFCRMAVQAHGGEIWARNNPDQGATFTFILPLTPHSKDLTDG